MSYRLRGLEIITLLVWLFGHRVYIKTSKVREEGYTATAIKNVFEKGIFSFPLSFFSPFGKPFSSAHIMSFLCSIPFLKALIFTRAFLSLFCFYYNKFDGFIILTVICAMCFVFSPVWSGTHQRGGRQYKFIQYILASSPYSTHTYSFYRLFVDQHYTEHKHFTLHFLV